MKKFAQTVCHKQIKNGIVRIVILTFWKLYSIGCKLPQHYFNQSKNGTTTKEKRKDGSPTQRHGSSQKQLWRSWGEFEVKKAVAVEKGTDKKSGRGAANKRQTSGFFGPFRPKLKRTQHCLWERWQISKTWTPALSKPLWTLIWGWDHLSGS